MQTQDRDSNSGSRNKLDSNLPPYKTTYKKVEGLKPSVGPLSPLRLFVTIIGGIFMAEVVSMIVVYVLPPLPYVQITLIDATIMTVLIFPLLYFLSFQPLLRYIEKSQQAEEKNILLSSIVEQTADTVVVTDREGLIEYVNPAFEQMTGFTKDEVLGKTPRVLKSGLHGQGFYKNLWDTILNGEVYQNEIANLKKNCELFYEVKTITPLRDGSGDITHFVATGKDITEHKQAEEQLRKAYDELELRVQTRTEELRIAISELEEEVAERKRIEVKLQAQAIELELQAEELRAQKEELILANERLSQSQEDLARAQDVGQVGSWRLDVRHNVLIWSEENHRIFGVPEGTPLTYETFLEIVHPDDRNYVDAQWNAGLTGEPYDIEHRIVVDGRVKWVREKAYLEFDDAGNLLGGFGITQDINERKQAEEEIQRAVEELRVANEELKRFNTLMVGRELRMIELKKEVNELCASAGQPLQYSLDFEKEGL